MPQLLNASIVSCLDWIDLAAPLQRGSLAVLLSECRVFLFQKTKERLLAETASVSTRPSSQPHVKYDRRTIKQRIARGEVDHEGRWSVFGRHLCELHKQAPAVLRRKEQLWSVSFEGAYVRVLGRSNVDSLVDPRRHAFTRLFTSVQLND